MVVQTYRRKARGQSRRLIFSRFARAAVLRHAHAERGSNHCCQDQGTAAAKQEVMSEGKARGLSAGKNALMFFDGPHISPVNRLR